MENIDSNISSEEELVGIDEVQKFLNRSRASVYRLSRWLGDVYKRQIFSINFRNVLVIKNF